MDLALKAANRSLATFYLATQANSSRRGLLTTAMPPVATHLSRLLLKLKEVPILPLSCTIGKRTPTLTTSKPNLVLAISTGTRIKASPLRQEVSITLRHSIQDLRPMLVAMDDQECELDKELTYNCYGNYNINIFAFE
jgi:hypothetical protein